MKKTLLNITLAKPFFLLFMALTVSQVYADDKTVPKFSELLTAYEQKVDINARNQALSERNNAVQESAESWLASDIGVVIHHETDALNDNLPATNWQLGATADIKWPKQREAMAHLAKVTSQGSLVEKTYWQWMASDHLRELIWNVKQTKITYQLDQKALNVAEKLLKRIRLQVNVGERSKLDQMFFEQEVLTLKSRFQASKVAFQNHLQSYKEWTGYSQLPIEIKETWQTKIKQTHPKLQKLQQALGQQQSQLELAQAEKSGAPNVYLGLQQDKQQSQRDESIVLEVTLPMGINPQQTKEVAEQKLLLSQLRYQTLQTEKALEIKLLGLRNTLKSMQQNLALSQSQLELAEQAYTLSEQAFNLGETNTQTLLKAQQSLIQSRKNYQIKNIDYGRLVAEYNQQAGYILGEQP